MKVPHVVCALVLLLASRAALSEDFCAASASPTFASVPTGSAAVEKDGLSTAKGHIYAVQREEQGWALIEVKGQQRWVHAKTLAEASECSAVAEAAGADAASASASASAKSTVAPGHSTDTVCPCGSTHQCSNRFGNYCVGTEGKRHRF